MTESNSERGSLVRYIYHIGIKPCIVQHHEVAHIHDPVFHINRNRVIAETLKAVLRCDIEDDTTIIKKLLAYLLSTQHADGSWSEIHPYYNQPSALITSIVGEAFLEALQHNLSYDELIPAVKRAKDYVIQNEKKSGFFLKSTSYTADHLNVDASCGAFLARYADLYDEEHCYQAAMRASAHIIDYQLDRGVFPYAVDKGNYEYIQNVPCVHYQGVTLYYLSKIHRITHDNRLKESLLGGVRWLAAMQKPSGRFNWGQSGLLFAYYLTGAYGFGYASFRYASQFDARYSDYAQRCFSVLNCLNHQRGLFPRWEDARWSSFPRSIVESARTAKVAKVGMNQSLFRFAYAGYRQIARRRYAETVDDTLFNAVVSTLGLNVSTVESFANYPDLFMTSEILDCLSSVS